MLGRLWKAKSHRKRYEKEFSPARDVVTNDNSSPYLQKLSIVEHVSLTTSCDRSFQMRK
jgi:hypothetical protein